MHKFEQEKIFIKNSPQENRLPRTYGAFINNEIIDVYQFFYEDLFVRPDMFRILILTIKKEYKDYIN